MICSCVDLIKLCQITFEFNSTDSYVPAGSFSFLDKLGLSALGTASSQVLINSLGDSQYNACEVPLQKASFLVLAGDFQGKKLINLEVLVTIVSTACFYKENFELGAQEYSLPFYISM